VEKAKTNDSIFEAALRQAVNVNFDRTIQSLIADSKTPSGIIASRRHKSRMQKVFARETRRERWGTVIAWSGGLAAAAIVFIVVAMSGLFDGVLPTPDPYPPVFPTAEPTPYVTEPPVHWPTPSPYGGRGCCCEYEFVPQWDWIDGRFISYVDADLFMDFIEYYTENYTAQTLTPRMIMVVFVEYFDISRESFDQINNDIIETARKSAEDDGVTFVFNPQEWYDADIIYTFDDAVINEFYRNRNLEFTSIWHSVPSTFADYVGAERFTEFSAWWAASGLQGRRMEAFGFIDYFNLSREEFDNINALWNERRMELGGFEDEKEYGLNADIIFTFDDTVINSYYRVVHSGLSGSNCAGTDCPHRDDVPYCVIHGPAGSQG